jgi:hypothetical protein
VSKEKSAWKPTPTHWYLAWRSPEGLFHRVVSGGESAWGHRWATATCGRQIRPLTEGKHVTEVPEEKRCRKCRERTPSSEFAPPEQPSRIELSGDTPSPFRRMKLVGIIESVGATLYPHNPSDSRFTLHLSSITESEAGRYTKREEEEGDVVHIDRPLDWIIPYQAPWNGRRVRVTLEVDS